MADSAAGSIAVPDVSQLQRILRARRVAIVGASESSRWSTTTLQTLDCFNFPGSYHLINRRGSPVHGHPTFVSCQEIGERIDVAVLLVGADSVLTAIEDAAAAGAEGVVVLAAGFGESGGAGQAAQAAMIDLVDRSGMTCFGPNCLGFVNLVDQVAAWASPPPVPDAQPGSIALISQSGGIAIHMGRFASKHGVRFSHIVSTGNEATLDTLDVGLSLVDDDRVRCLAMFVEGIGHPDRFDILAARAAELGKPIVMVKAGRSALGAKVIASHTGTIAGDDAVIDAVLREAGVIRVGSLEELVVTAGLASSIGRLRAGRLGVVSISGGACDIVSDYAETTGTPLAEFAKETQQALRDEGVAGGTAQNPLDVTGAAVTGPDMMVKAVEVVAADPDVAVVVIVEALPDGIKFADPSARLRALGRVGRTLPVPSVLLHPIAQDVPSGTAELLADAGIDRWACGLEAGIGAIGRLIWWSDRRTGSRRVSLQSSAPSEAGGPRLESEPELLDLLERRGVPCVPRLQVATADGAVEAARLLGYPVAVKVVSSTVVHKSDIGGVVLDVGDDDAVRAAARRVLEAGGTRAEGVLVASMRPEGLELIVGVVRQSGWGLMLALGFGGLLVHHLDDTVLCRLPVDELDVQRLLGQLRGRQLFEGVRGRSAADLEGVARAVARVSEIAIELGPELESLEVNPLWVGPDSVEALDAVATWRERVGS
jgi:acyl-CoA synthetase (NDP forming)